MHTQWLWIWSTNYKNICSNAFITHSASAPLPKLEEVHKVRKVTVQKLLFPCKQIQQKFPSCICPLMRTSIRCRISTLRSGICINSSADQTHLSTYSTFVKRCLECSLYVWQLYMNYWGRTRVYCKWAKIVCNDLKKHGNIIQ